jgi:IclR family acetate operon transcriptional repressor
MADQGKGGQMRGESTYHTRALSRAFQILNSFSIQDFELSVGELHEKLGIHKSTLVRLLQSMAAEGFIDQNPETGDYRLGIRTFELGSLYHRSRMLNIGIIARPLMERLTAQLNLSSNLAVRDGQDIIYVETIEPAGSPMRVSYGAGDRFGVHHTALGKAMIAFLPQEQLGALLVESELTPLTPRTIVSMEELHSELGEIRACGYAVDDEESLPGLRCVSAPIWNGTRVVAALSVSGSTLLVTKERTAEIAEVVMAVTKELSCQLGGEAPESK